MLIRLFDLDIFDIAEGELSAESEVNSFVVATQNAGGRIISIELSPSLIMVVYEYLPDVSDPQ